MFLLRIAEALVAGQESHLHSTAVAASAAASLLSSSSSSSSSCSSSVLTTHSPNTLEERHHDPCSRPPNFLEHTDSTSSRGLVTLSTAPPGDSSLSTEVFIDSGEQQLSRIRLSSSSVERCSPSPGSTGTTTSVRTVSPATSSGASPQLGVHSPQSQYNQQRTAVTANRGSPQHPRSTASGQLHQGLLYNLLVNSETAGSQSRSPVPCCSPLLQTSAGSNSPARTGPLLLSESMHTESNDSSITDLTMNDAESGETALIGSKINTPWSQTLTGTVAPYTNGSVENVHIVPNGRLQKTKKLNPHHHHHHQNSHFRNRANSLGCKMPVQRPYVRPHAASVGAASDLYPAIRARLQQRRHMEAPQQQHGQSAGQHQHPLDTSQSLRPRLSLRYRHISKSHEATLSSAGASSTEINPHGLMVTAGGSTQRLTHPDSPIPTHYTVQSAQARLQQAPSGHTPPAGNYRHECSPCTSHHSPITSSVVSIDSGLDDPQIDIAGFNLISTSTTSTSSLFGQATVAVPLPPTDMVLDTTPLMAARVNGLTRCTDSNPPVQLAKKTARPVQARVTEWLRQNAEFIALSAPVIGSWKLSPSQLAMPTEFPFPLAGLGENGGAESTPATWLLILTHCWHRLLALSLAEHALDLVVVEDKSQSSTGNETDHVDTDQVSLPWLLLTLTPGPKNGAASESSNKRPDRQFANSLTQLMGDIRQAALNAQEFYLLRHVILLTAQEPMCIPTLGLNVIRAARSLIGPCSQEMTTHSSPSRLNGRGKSTNSWETELNGTPTFDLVCLVSALKSLSSLCPHRMANLLCTHLRASGSPLATPFLAELHTQFLRAQQEHLERQTRSHGNGDVAQPPGTANPDGNRQSKMSILEQLFDSS